MKRKYDLVFSLGGDCHCATALRRAGLQLLSFPLDWIGPMTDTTPRKISARGVREKADMICGGFADFIRPDDFVVEGESREHPTARCYNRRTGWSFYHDFPAFTSLDVSFPEVQRRYERRISRFLELLSRARHALFVHADSLNQDEPTSDEDCVYARERLSRAFPEIRFDCIHIRHIPGLPFERRTSTCVSDGHLRIEFDYAGPDDSADDSIPDIDSLAETLAALAKVRDYRSSRERAAWRRKALEKKWKANGTDNAIDYRLKKLREKLARLRTRLPFSAFRT